MTSSTKRKRRVTISSPLKSRPSNTSTSSTSTSTSKLTSTSNNENQPNQTRRRTRSFSKSNHTHAHSTTTSTSASSLHHSSINLGSDAASSYYFSSTPQTPAVTKSIRKSKRQRIKLKEIENTLLDSSIQEEAVVGVTDGRLAPMEKKDDHRTGTGTPSKATPTKSKSNSTPNKSTPNKSTSTPTRTYNLRNSTKKQRPKTPSSSSFNDSIDESALASTQELDALFAMTSNGNGDDDDTGSLLLSPATPISTQKRKPNGRTTPKTTPRSKPPLTPQTRSQTKAKSHTSTSSSSPTSNHKDTSMNLDTSTSTMNTSVSEGDEDTINKSVLSDTTELTASNFVLCARSKQAFLSFLEEEKIKKKKQQQQQQKEKDGSEMEKDLNEKMNSKDAKETSEAKAADISKPSNKTTDNDLALLDDSIQTSDLVSDSFQTKDNDTTDLLSLKSLASPKDLTAKSKQAPSVSSTPSSLASSRLGGGNDLDESVDTMEIAALFNRSEMKATALTHLDQVKEGLDGQDQGRRDLNDSVQTSDLLNDGPNDETKQSLIRSSSVPMEGSSSSSSKAEDLNVTAPSSLASMSVDDSKEGVDESVDTIDIAAILERDTGNSLIASFEKKGTSESNNQGNNTDDSVLTRDLVNDSRDNLNPCVDKGNQSIERSSSLPAEASASSSSSSAVEDLNMTAPSYLSTSKDGFKSVAKDNGSGAGVLQGNKSLDDSVQTTDLVNDSEGMHTSTSISVNNDGNQSLIRSSSLPAEASSSSSSSSKAEDLNVTAPSSLASASVDASLGLDQSVDTMDIAAILARDSDDTSMNKDKPFLNESVQTKDLVNDSQDIDPSMSEKDDSAQPLIRSSSLPSGTSVTSSSTPKVEDMNVTAPSSLSSTSLGNANSSTDQSMETMDIAAILGRDAETSIKSSSKKTALDRRKSTLGVEIASNRENSERFHGDESDDTIQTTDLFNDNGLLSSSSKSISSSSRSVEKVPTPKHHEGDESVDTTDIARMFGSSNDKQKGSPAKKLWSLGSFNKDSDEKEDETSVEVARSNSGEGLHDQNANIEANDESQNSFEVDINNPSNFEQTSSTMSKGSSDTILHSSSQSSTPELSVHHEKNTSVDTMDTAELFDPKDDEKSAAARDKLCAEMDISQEVVNHGHNSDEFNNSESVDTKEIAELFGRSVDTRQQELSKSKNDDKKNQSHEKEMESGMISFDTSTINLSREDTADFTLGTTGRSSRGILYQSPFLRKSAFQTDSGTLGESPITMATGEFSIFSEQNTSSVRKMKANLQKTKQKLSQKRKRLSSTNGLSVSLSKIKPMDRGNEDTADEKQSESTEAERIMPSRKNEEKIESKEDIVVEDSKGSEVRDSKRNETKDLRQAQRNTSKSPGRRKIRKLESDSMRKSPARNLNPPGNKLLGDILNSEESSRNDDIVDDTSSTSSGNDSSLEQAEYTETFESILASPLQKRSESTKVSGFMLGRNKSKVSKRRQSSIGCLTSVVHGKSTMETVEEVDSQLVDESKDTVTSTALSPAKEEDKIIAGIEKSLTPSSDSEKDLEYSSSSISNVGTIVSSAGSLSSRSNRMGDTSFNSDRYKNAIPKHIGTGENGQLMGSPVDSTVTMNHGSKDFTWSSTSSIHSSSDSREPIQDSGDGETMELLGMIDKVGDGSNPDISDQHTPSTLDTRETCGRDDKEETLDTLNLMMKSPRKRNGLKEDAEVTKFSVSSRSDSSESDTMNIDDIIAKASRPSSSSKESGTEASGLSACDDINTIELVSNSFLRNGTTKDSSSTNASDGESSSGDEMDIDDILLRVSRPSSDNPIQNNDSDESIVSVSHDEDDSDDDDNMADTMAFRKLMADLDTKESSVQGELQRNMENEDENNANAEMDRTRNSGISPSNVLNSTTQSEQDESKDEVNLSAIRSPSKLDLKPKTPKSILNSSRIRGIVNGSSMRSTSKRSVNFGSPVAAEYNVGSPPMSMTPMCSKRTKALFTIPQNSALSSKCPDSNMTTSSNEISLGLGSDESTTHIGNDTSDLNDSFQGNTDDKTMELESNMNHFLANINDTSSTNEQHEINASEIQKQLFSGDANEEPCSSATPIKNQIQSQSLRDQTPSETIEMEPNLNKLLANIGDDYNVSSTTDEVLMESTSKMTAENHTSTIDMEPNMKEVIANMGNASSPDSLNSSVCSQSPTKTIGLEKDLKSALGTIGASMEDSSSSDGSEVFSPIKNTANEANVKDATQTIGIESNMMALLAKMGNDTAPSQPNDTEHTHDSKYSIVGKSIGNTRFGEILDDDSMTLSLDERAEILQMSEETQTSHHDHSTSTRTEDINITDNLQLSMTDQMDVSSSSGREGTNNSTLDDESSNGSSLNLSKTTRDTNKDINMSESWNVSVTGSTFAGTKKTLQPVPSTESSSFDSSSENEFGDPTISHFESTQSTIDSSDDSNVALNIKWSEVEEVINPATISFDETFTNEMATLASDLHFPFAVESINNFISDVCEEVERNVTEMDTDYEGRLSAECESNSNVMFKMQNSLRGHYGKNQMDMIRNLLNNLQGTVQETVMNEFSEWESQVTDAVLNTLDGISDTLSNEEHEIDRHDSSTNKLHKSVSKVSRHVAKKAQRKSIGRRKDVASELEAEILELEESIKTAENDLSVKHQEQSDMEEALRMLTVKDSVHNECTIHQKVAESKFHQFVSVEEMFPWKISRQDEDGMSVSFKNRYNVPEELSLNINFNNSSTGAISCQATFANNEAVKIAQKRSYSVTYDRFYCNRVNHAMKTVNTRKLSGPDEIRATIEYVSWYLQRIEIIWNELTHLASAYKGKIEISDRDVLLHIKFGRNKKDVSVIFGIGVAYPFCMLDMRLKGNVNIAGLEQYVSSKAKPGFGYVTKACGLISSYLQR